MIDKVTRIAYPISWIVNSQVLLDFLECETPSEDEMFIADFASGEHDRVPTFLLRVLRSSLRRRPRRRWVTYSIDLHALRLDSLLGKLEEESLLGNARVVQARLETMRTSATLRPGLVAFLEKHDSMMTMLDRILLLEEHIPAQSFELGILNNDVVGYLHEYYTEYGHPSRALEGVHQVMKTGGLIIVTMPGLLYPVDNVRVLESLGFSYVQAVDIDTSSGVQRTFDEKPEDVSFSSLGHYSFLVFSK